MELQRIGHAFNADLSYKKNIDENILEHY